MKLTDEERQILVNLEYEKAVAMYICKIPGECCLSENYFRIW